MEKTSFSNSGDQSQRFSKVHDAVNRLEEAVAELQEGAAPDATDAAKELANERGVDLADVYGTGKGGRIVHGDVEDYLEGRESGDQGGQEEADQEADE